MLFGRKIVTSFWVAAFIFSTNAVLGSRLENSFDATLNKSKTSWLNKKTDIHPKILNLALKAFHKAKIKGLTTHPKNLLTIVDYSRPSNEKRLWVLDLDKEEVQFHTYVSHGKGSGKKYAKYFSDTPNTQQSSLGAFLTGDSYMGKHGLSLRLHGLEKGINGNAYQRTIVVHGAHYASEQFAKKQGWIGRSWGCFALDKKITQSFIEKLKGGSFLFAYYPDSKWLSSSDFF